MCELGPMIMLGNHAFRVNKIRILEASERGLDVFCCDSSCNPTTAIGVTMEEALEIINRALPQKIDVPEEPCPMPDASTRCDTCEHFEPDPTGLFGKCDEINNTVSAWDNCPSPDKYRQKEVQSE